MFRNGGSLEEEYYVKTAILTVFLRNFDCMRNNPSLVKVTVHGFIKNALSYIYFIQQTEICVVTTIMI